MEVWQRNHQVHRKVVTKTTFETPETAARVRNEMAAAVFRYQNEEDRFSASIPLDRIVSIDQTDWPGFCRVCSTRIRSLMQAKHFTRY